MSNVEVKSEVARLAWHVDGVECRDSQCPDHHFGYNVPTAKVVVVLEGHFRFEQELEVREDLDECSGDGGDGDVLFAAVDRAMSHEGKFLRAGWPKGVVATVKSDKGTWQSKNWLRSSAMRSLALCQEEHCPRREMVVTETFVETVAFDQHGASDVLKQANGPRMFTCGVGHKATNEQVAYLTQLYENRKE